MLFLRGLNGWYPIQHVVGVEVTSSGNLRNAVGRTLTDAEEYAVVFRLLNGAVPVSLHATRENAEAACNDLVLSIQQTMSQR